jgi:eukaryotic-like serine/threonine-protein kinase
VRSVEEISPGLVLGRYECLLPIARGGQAAVWAARVTGARGFEKIVAIKAMLPGVSEDSNFERMFLDEARIASNVKHPNVVEIVDLGEQGSLLYLVMEFVEGETLYDLIHLTRKKGIPGPLAIKIVMDVCSGLHAAHELKENGVALDLVHRDVSPQNVMISEQGIVKILDFGVARIKGRMSQATADGYVKGKTNYLSPEQISGGSIDRKTDIFALGVMLYQLTTTRHPFAGDTEGQTLNAILRCKFRPPSEMADSYPPALEKVVMRAMEREPEFRFQTAQDMYRELDAVLATMTRPTSEDLAKFIKPCIEERLSALRASLQQARKTGSAKQEPDAAEPGAKAESKASDAAVRAPIVHTPTAGGGSSVSAWRRMPGRKRVLPVAITLAVASVLGLLALRAKLTKPGSQDALVPATALAAPSSTQTVAPSASEPAAASVSAEPVAGDSSSAPAQTSAEPVAAKGGARPSGRASTPSIPTQKKGGKGGKKWTPPVTESGL